MKQILYVFILLIINVSCKDEVQKSKILSSENNINEDNNQQEKTLKEFYFLFYGVDELPNEKLKEKYLSKTLINEINRLTSDSENLVLDYDPFIKGQDFNAESVRKSIKITPLKNKNEYKVSFNLFGRESEKNTEIDVFLIYENERYLIHSVLNDKHLNLPK